MLWAAVVKNAGTFRLMPLLFTVHATPFAVRAVFNPIASLLARAVVRYDGTASFKPAVSCVPATTAPATVVVVNPVAAKAVLALLTIAVVKPLWLAVIWLLFDIPNEMPFEFAKLTVVAEPAS